MELTKTDNTKDGSTLLSKSTEDYRDIIEIPDSINIIVEKTKFNFYEDLNEAILDSLILMKENGYCKFSMNELNFEVSLSKTELIDLFEFFFEYSHNKAKVNRSDFEDGVLVLNVIFEE